MPEATHAARSTPYASSDDFCRIFNQEMDGFYLLSFLLTGDREKAEQSSLQRVGTLLGPAGGHPECRASHQPAASGNCRPFEFCLT
jgi:hypothetical protein